jgi:MarR family transcriptional regulator, lower aerobic nicotinate degradation pathway regulator
MKNRKTDAQTPATGAAPEPRALLDSCGFLLARLGSESRRQFTRLLEGHDLSMHHFALLLALADRQGVPQQTISALVGVDPRNAAPLVEDLERRGLIARGADPNDRRRYKISLTRDGQRKMSTLRTAGAALENDLLKALSKDEREHLHNLLVKLFSALEGPDPV